MTFGIAANSTRVSSPQKKPRLQDAVYFNPLLPGFTGALPALHIGQESAS